ncbi:MAG: ABC transporter permease subunit [Acidobacteriota bacterium]
MNGLLATFERELRAYFVSPLAWIILTGFLFVQGVVFGYIAWVLLGDPMSAGRVAPLSIFFGGFFFWPIMLFVAPILTMRLLAEERRSGTIEMLMTAPVSEAGVVVGKYLAVVVLWLFLWLPTLVYALVLDYHGDVDWGPVASSYLGVILIGALFLAIGLFASSLTRNQIIAAVITFAFLLLLVLSVVGAFLARDPVVQEILGYVNVVQHMDELGRGIVDTRRLVFYLSTIGFFLFLTTRALAARKWR